MNKPYSSEMRPDGQGGTIVDVDCDSGITHTHYSSDNSTTLCTCSKPYDNPRKDTVSKHNGVDNAERHQD